MPPKTLRKRYYYYVGVKHTFSQLYSRHCDIFSLQERYNDYELKMKFQSTYAFMWGAYIHKWEAVQTAQYQGYVIDNQ